MISFPLALRPFSLNGELKFPWPLWPLLQTEVLASLPFFIYSTWEFSFILTLVPALSLKKKSYFCPEFSHLKMEGLSYHASLSYLQTYFSLFLKAVCLYSLKNVNVSEF